MFRRLNADEVERALRTKDYNNVEIFLNSVFVYPRMYGVSLSPTWLQKIEDDLIQAYLAERDFKGAKRIIVISGNSTVLKRRIRWFEEVSGTTLDDF